MSNEQDVNTTEEQAQTAKRKKSNRAAVKSDSGNDKPADPKPAQTATRDGKTVRKTASGFTVVG
jgi:hypothetical protein